MGFIVENDLVYEVIEFPDGGISKECRGTVMRVQIDGPENGRVGDVLTYSTYLVTWQNEAVVDDLRTVQIQVWYEDELVGQLEIAQNTPFELVFPAAGRYKVRGYIDGTHTPATKVVVVSE